MAEENTFPIEQFKSLLSTFIRTNLKGYHFIADSIDKAEPTERSLLSELKWNVEDLFEALGGDWSSVSDLEDEISDLEYEIRNLEEENDRLEYELKESRLIIGSTLNDEYKIKFFREYHENYTPWEIEELLMNGKKYLNKK
jgi:hypothetical protein